MTFLYTSTVSGIVYMACYLLIANPRNDLYTGLSFLIGLGVYLVIRSTYKLNNDLDPVLARTYRLIICLVPVLLLVTNIVSLYNTPVENPSYTGFLSFEDLSWSGPFVIAFWPLLNLASLLINIGTVFIIIINVLTTYGLIAFAIILVVALIVLLTKLKRLKSQSALAFSLIIAFIKVIVPLIVFTSVVYFRQ